MSSFKIFDIAGSGMSAQSVRLNTVASNLANADSVSGDRSRSTRRAIRSSRRCARSLPAAGRRPGRRGEGARHHRGHAAPEMRYEPGNPLANAEGYVFAPNVNVVEEMVDMISASRSYQNNVEVMNTSKELLLATLRLGQLIMAIDSVSSRLTGRQLRRASPRRTSSGRRSSCS